ncbi:type IV secretion protein Rhs [Pseudomonas protegens]|uniref:RHS repeat-associated core domain-containing protein n=1 Tax=Pseudomonas protegens TaxID=380021 RepID=UPI000C9C5EE1|nr:RHS repeat-associated core domain-containing protein [Pseudomonas protegens]PNG32119.1 type IV secretion protein Rhs [Pseudomonas protegens]
MDSTDQEQAPREPQIAVAPLNTIDAADVGQGAAQFDAWLRAMSNDTVTLERIRSVAGALPVVGNIIALVDALGDIVTLSRASKREMLDWVSLGINLIGVLPAPPTMAAARMSLRPSLFLVRQELKATGKSLVGDALIGVILAHLNATIVGEIDDFVQQAEGKISGILSDAGELGQNTVVEIASGLEALVQGKLDAKGDAEAAAQQMREAGDQLLHDPKTSISNFFGAVWSAYKAVGKAAANTAAKNLLDEKQRQLALSKTRALREFAPELREQVASLGDPETVNSIGNLLKILSASVTAWRSRGAHGHSTNIKPKGTSEARDQRSGNQLESQSRQGPATQDPSPQKAGTCTGTCGSISFAMGSEIISHTDFTLPGPFPIDWTRTYRSSLSAYDDDELGARWITPFTTRLDLIGDGLRYHAADGRSFDYPLPKVGEAHDDRVENLTLIRVSDVQIALCRGFDRRETYRRDGERFLLVQIELRGGAGMLLGYEHRMGKKAVLSDLMTYQDEPGQVHTHLGTLVDEDGRITGLWLMGEKEPQRRLSLYQYDDAGDLILAQDENAATWTYQYQHHLVTRYTDRSGRGMNLRWQGEGPDARAVHEWADDGSFETRLEWDRNIRLTYVTDANGHETWHYYDSLGYPYRVRHPDGLSEWFFRDDAKNIVRHVHTDGSEDRYAYDERGVNLLEHTQADGNTVHYAWDAKDQLIKISDAEGGQWSRDYDLRGNLTEAVDPLGNKTEYKYNQMGLPTAITDANGNEKKLKYNDSGQLTDYVDCSGKASAWEYDARGQLICFTDALGQKTSYHYDAGQLAVIVHPDKTEERFERDAEGRLLGHIDALGQATSWSYSEAGLLTERIDAAGQTLRYQWDRLGRLQRLQNENEQYATFVYDPVGRLLKEAGFDGHNTRYEYAPETGRLARTIDGQRVISLEFDPMGRLTERRASLSIDGAVSSKAKEQLERYAYDGNGNLLLASNNDSKLQFFHDAAGNLTREHQHYSCLKQPQVAVWQHQYDALNQRIATVRPDGHKVSWLTYGSGHLLGMRLDAHELLVYERDDLHREVARHQGNQLLQTQKWGPLGRLQEQWLGSGDGKSTLIKRGYQYDAIGQLLQIDDNRRGSLSYQYDPVGRLLSATSRLGQETFAFDPASNLLAPKTADLPQRGLPRSRLLDNLLREYAGTHYQYDDRGNLAQRLRDGQRSHFTWDLFDRLVSYRDDRLQANYAYDALGRRLYKQTEAHYQDRPEDGSELNRLERLKRNRQFDCGVTLYGWDGDTLAWESRAPDKAGEGARTTHYLYEPGSFVPVAQAVHKRFIPLIPEPEYGAFYQQENDPLWADAPKPKEIDALAWYQCDHLGTPHELTDQTGDVVWSAQYKAWGGIKEERSSNALQQGIANPLRFQGQYHDPETGLHYNRYRYYDPEVGRFVSKDPIGYAGGLNLFQYAPNPIEWIDPLGLAKKIGDTHCSCVICPAPKKVDPRNLNSRQTREEMSRNKVDKLSKKMRSEGFDENHPIDVAEVDGKLIIIDGHHRSQAAVRSRVEKVPVVIHDVDPTTATRLEDDMFDSRCK